MTTESRYEQLKLHGKCPNCGKMASSGHTYCEDCLAERRAKFHKQIYCIDCGKEIPCDGPGGRSKICDECLPKHRKEYLQKWRNSLTEEDRARMRTEARARVSADRAIRSEHHFSLAMQRRYGMTLDEFIAMYNQQAGCCAICHKKLPEIRSSAKERRNLVIDHDHISGKVRGILCKPCNFALGLLGDNIDNLRSAISYLS